MREYQSAIRRVRHKDYSLGLPDKPPTTRKNLLK
jgi:hypothetical protein